jgi:hypothetical protein
LDPAVHAATGRAGSTILVYEPSAAGGGLDNNRSDRCRARPAVHGRSTTDFVQSASHSTVRVGRLAAAAGVVLTELSVHRASLEDAFMHITGQDIEYTAGNSADGADRSPALAGAGGWTR